MLSKKGKKVNRGIKINKKKIAFIFWSFICLIFVIYLFYCNVKMFQKRSELSKNLKEIDSNVETLTKEKEILSFRLGETYSDEYLEKVAREDLGMKKVGENVVVIKKDIDEGNANIQSEGILQTFSFWIDWIKNRFNPPE
jgi:cell division protein FtsB